MPAASTIRLRPLVISDAETTWKWRNQTVVRDFFSGHDYRVTLEDEQHWMQNQIGGDQPNVTFAIMRTDTDELIGMTFLKNINTNFRQAEFAILIDAAHTGHGFGTAACRAMLAHGFLQLQLHRIYLKVRVDNFPAIRSYEKCGFKVEGTLRDDVFKGGKFIDQFSMSVLEKEFSTKE
jgi:RimJ/RimL family protein N-acetyltransferase